MWRVAQPRPPSLTALFPPPPVPCLQQNLEVMYDQFVAKDGRRGVDWTEVAVCIVQDGIGNADEGVLAASTVHGFFSPVVLQSGVLSAPTTLHLFEYTARWVCHEGCGWERN